MSSWANSYIISEKEEQIDSLKDIIDEYKSRERLIIFHLRQYRQKIDNLKSDIDDFYNYLSETKNIKAL